MIRILAVGRKHELWVNEGVLRYEKRLSKPWNTEWVLLPHSSLESARAREEESGRIHSRIKDDDFVVVLDERGKTLDSPALSKILQAELDKSRPVVCIIGGAYGVSENLIDRADFVWSLSPLVFPHQLVRLILTEQLYRAQEISSGRPYHHE